MVFLLLLEVVEVVYDEILRKEFISSALVTGASRISGSTVMVAVRFPPSRAAITWLYSASASMRLPGESLLKVKLRVLKSKVATEALTGSRSTNWAMLSVS